VFLKHHGSCSGPDDHPCGSVPEEEHRQPVCGTDGKSYVSPEALWCAKLRSPERGEICKSYDISVINLERILPFVMLTFAFAWRHFHSVFSSLINLLTSRKITYVRLALFQFCLNLQMCIFDITGKTQFYSNFRGYLVYTSLRMRKCPGAVTLRASKQRKKRSRAINIIEPYAKLRHKLQHVRRWRRWLFRLRSYLIHFWVLKHNDIEISFVFEIKAFLDRLHF